LTTATATSDNEILDSKRNNSGSNSPHQHHLNTAHDTFPEITQTVPLINRMVATPRVAKATDALSEFAPAMYAVVIVQVIVMLPEVLLKMLIALPSENVASGIVIDPPEPTCTYLPTSPVASVYEPVFVPTAGMLLKPTAFVPSTVQEDNTPCEGVPN
jgi:hypothetical protein